MNTYGLLLRRYQRYGYHHIVAELVKREDDHYAPRNVSDKFLWDDTGRPKFYTGLCFADLRMEGFYGSDDKLIGYEPAYHDVGRVDQHDAERMAKTLKLIRKQIDKDDSLRDAGDCFMSLCTALRLSFVVENRDPESRASSYDDNRWRWMTIGEGRNRYRQMIAEDTKRLAGEAA